METRSGLGVLVTPEARHQGVSLMRPQRTTLFRACAQCGKGFEPDRSNVRRGGGIFCSRSCRSVADRSVPDDQRFWAKVDKNGPVPNYRPDLGPCWLWTAAKFRHGYGQFVYRDADGADRRISAHRWSYEQEHGPIQDGLQLDHLCRTPACVRPSHTEPVLPRDNALRGVHPNAVAHVTEICRRGHPLTGDNVRLRSDGRRQCKACQAAGDKARYEARR